MKTWSAFLQSASAATSAWVGPAAPRERRWAAWGLLALIVGLAWQWTVSPALQTIGRAPEQRAQLELQLQLMQAQAREAAQLRAMPTLTGAPALAALKAATDRLGASAKLSVQGERAVITLDGVGSAALRAWLAEVRSGARGRPIEAQLARTAKGYSGTITVALPTGGPA
jgi:general secretion pathway protein M